MDETLIERRVREGVGPRVLEGGVRFEGGERHEDMFGDLEETVSPVTPSSQAAM